MCWRLTSGRKHYTSKLSTFENLDELETFGFRGEALTSLCALADVQIVTATREQAPMATKLEFDHIGEMVSKKVASAKVPSYMTIAEDSVGLLFLLQICFRHYPCDGRRFPRTANVNLRKRLLFFKDMH